MSAKILPFPVRRLPTQPVAHSVKPLDLNAEATLRRKLPTVSPRILVSTSHLVIAHVGDPHVAKSKPALEKRQTHTPVSASTTESPVIVTRSDAQVALNSLTPFLSQSQRSAVFQGFRSEEKQFFFDKMVELAAVVRDMPHTYQTRGMGDEALVHLHYFIGGCDWHIIEKDKGTGEADDDGQQHQAFGLANLGHGAELGYISIAEIIAAGGELDFYWNPKSLGKIQGKEKPEALPSPPAEIVIPLPEASTPETPALDNPLGEGQSRFLTLPDGWQVGAILHCSWGYEQTNADFYRIIKRTGSMIEVEQLATNLSEQHFMSGKAVPTNDVKPNTKILRRKIRFDGNSIPSSCKVESYSSASLWNGEPKSCSWYA